jgi:hypothetical protein
MLSFIGSIKCRRGQKPKKVKKPLPIKHTARQPREDIYLNKESLGNDDELTNQTFERGTKELAAGPLAPIPANRRASLKSRGTGAARRDK